MKGTIKLNETFICSDLHLGHGNILNYQSNTRPFASKELLAMFERKNNGEKFEGEEKRHYFKLLGESLVYHNEELIDRWNSIINPKDVVYNLGDTSFTSVEKTATLLDRLHGKMYLVKGNHERVMFNPKIKPKLGWIKDYYELKGFTKSGIILFHYPIESWSRQHHGAIHFNGHAHSNGKDFGRRKDVGMDGNNCYPYHLPTLVNEMNKLPIVNDGGHHTVREGE